MAGIGPATSPLPRECSTTEPHGLITLSKTNAMFGAGDEARTRDIQFGKLKLYQLSYSRTAAHQSCQFKITLSFMVEGEGFEPSYSERTDLQSVAFNHSATPPNRTRDYA